MERYVEKKIVDKDWNDKMECFLSLQQALAPFYCLPYTWLSVLEYGCLLALKISSTDKM